MAKVYSFHVGRPLNLWERCCLQSVADHGHDITVFSYDTLELPTGVQFAHAENIVPQTILSNLLGLAPTAFAQFSDLFRYELLARYGGWWFDTDVLCLSALLPEQPLLLVRKSGDRILNAPIYSDRGHPLMVEAAAYARTHILRATKMRRDFLGPTLISRLVLDHHHQGAVVEASTFCPVRGADVYSYLDPERCDAVYNMVSNCPAIHIFQETFRRVNFPRDVLPPAGSFLAERFTEHGGAGHAHLRVQAFQGAARNELEYRRKRRERPQGWTRAIQKAARRVREAVRNPSRVFKSAVR